jgi:DNA helicase HerA-like ATPase
MELGSQGISILRFRGFGVEALALSNRFSAAKEWGIFGEKKMPGILEPGKCTILDVSLTPQNVRALLVSIVCKKILDQRIRARRAEELVETTLEKMERIPMPWIFIDEAHNFVPSAGRTAASDVLGRIVREGRQPGLTLLFATQQPERLNAEALSQSDLVISFRLTAKADIDALKSVMQTYLVYDITKYINELPRVKGTAIILDDNSERIYKAQLRPRQSWHAGSSPVAI